MDELDLLKNINHIKREERIKILGHENKVIWLTGLSGSGKSTLGMALEKRLHQKGIINYVLDGDEIRAGINKDLDFSKESRMENLRRIGEISKILYNTGVFVIACFISPYVSVRENIRKLIGKDFVEVYVKCDLAECEKRDPKGLYERARAGLIKEFTGISSPYEEPENPEIVVDTAGLTVEESVGRILEYLGDIVH